MARGKWRGGADDRSVRPPVLGRREVLRRGIGMGAGLLAGGALGAGRPRRAPARDRTSEADPRVVVVGAGLAGLAAAHRIHRLAGWVPEVYEAQDRVGGRVRTIRGLAGGRTAEAGGGGISTGDAVIRGLCDELGLPPLADTWSGYPDGPEVSFYLGRRRAWGRIGDGVREVRSAASRAWVEIGRRIPTHRNANASARRYDRMTVADFVREHTSSRVARAYLEQEFSMEYGGPADRASALHLILESAGFWGPARNYDERLAVPGGNDTVASALEEALPPGAVRRRQALVAVRADAGGATLTFDEDGVAHDVAADVVVLAIPFSTLRLADLSGAELSPVKLRAIDETGIGTGVKMNLQFAPRPWARHGDSGDANTDLVIGTTWQSSEQQGPSVLVSLSNLTRATGVAHGTAPPEVLEAALDAIETLWPGARADFVDGQAYLDEWPSDPWALGSYSFSPPGGFTSYGGAEAGASGPLHFAGEHTAPYAKGGTMEGAVRSGERAAREVVGA